MKQNEESYSPWTLKLKSLSTNAMFWNYRCDDVREQYSYYVVILIALIILHLVDFIRTQDK